MTNSILLQHARLINSDDDRAVDVLVRDGMIIRIAAEGFLSDEVADEVIDATGKLLFPGLIDTHVHFREPGFPDKATMATEAAAALAGGVTTVCDMPNTNPPTVTVAALADKVRRSESLLAGGLTPRLTEIDMRFYFGITEATHIQTLRELWTGGSEELKRLKARCCGVKLYFDHSTGNQGAGSDVLEEAFKTCGELGIQIVAHCEDPLLNNQAADTYKNDESIQPPVRRHSFMRPPESEAKAITKAIDLARRTKARLHIAHLSTNQGVALVSEAKKEGLMVTCEVAPHHLFLTEDDYDMLGTLAKMNPPLRSIDHVKALWHGIKDGTVDSIATDHAPHTLAEKTDVNPLEAPSGVPGVETMLPLLLSVAARQFPHPGETNDELRMTNRDIFRLCFENPNKICSLGKKGMLEGAPANFLLIDPGHTWVIHAKDLHSKCMWTPYEGWKVCGKVERVIV